jgi:hypothetical protein
MILVAAPRASAFVVNGMSKHSTTTGSYHYDCYSCCCQSEYQSRLYGIEQWRDLPETIWNDSDEDDVIQVRTVPILTRESQNLLLQGQTLHLPLTEADDIRVFQRAMQDNERIFGMGLLEYHDHDEDDDDDDDDDESHGETTTTFLQTIPLLEIQDYKLETRDRSYCIAKVVGRAGVHKIIQETDDSHKSNSNNQQPIAVLCTETFDTFQESNLEKANTLASLIENLIADTSDIEESCRRHTSKRRAADDESSWRNQDHHHHHHRHDYGSTRMLRYQAAYQSALENDSQGYLLPPCAMSSSSLSSSTSSLSVPVATAAAAASRSWQELTAISWAAFATGACLADDSTFRLSALDMDCVSNRLQLAVYWLSDVRFEVEQQVRYR